MRVNEGSIEGWQGGCRPRWLAGLLLVLALAPAVRAAEPVAGAAPLAQPGRPLLPSQAAPAAEGARASGPPKPPQAASMRGPGGPWTATALAREAAFDAFYGLYVGGQKVGFMHASLTAAPKVEFAYQLEATIGGMGQHSRVAMQERRTFAPTHGQLTAVSFAQTTATGSVSVTGHRLGQSFAVEVVAGGARRRHTLAVTETLADSLAAWRLARPWPAAPAVQVGDVLLAQHFDPVSQAMTQAEHKVTKIDQQLLGGVASQAVHIETQYTALAVREDSVLDARGQLLSSHIGGFFEARLEDEAVAKRLDAPGDLLLDAVVKVPNPLPGLEAALGLNVTFSGFVAPAPPSTWRQQVSQSGNDVSMALRLEPNVPAGLSLADLQPRRRSVGKLRGGAKPVAPGTSAPAPEATEVAEARLPTAFVQSDAPAIVAAAKEAARGQANVREVVASLVTFVRSRLRSEYVPAFSNALEALRSGRGDCTEHSVLFVALARALGLPARVAVGVAYWPPGKGFGWHAWSEVWLGDRWLSVDPTWGQNVADVTHIKLAGGEPNEQLKVVMLLGQLRVKDWQLR